jgi:hypothetical protein
MPKLALGAAAALAAISLSPGSAQAYVVTVGGVQYDVTTFTGTYNANTSKFATPANSGVMPWWGSSSLASQFATAVGSSFGFPNPSGRGPYFAYEAFSTAVRAWQYNQSGQVAFAGTAQSLERSWAQATSVPVPGPLPLLGAGAAFGFSRKLRKPIKLEPNALGSAMPLA